jgi:hypothetical protein
MQKKRARFSMDDGCHDEFQLFQANGDEVDHIPHLIQFGMENLDTPHWAQLSPMVLSMDSSLSMFAEVDGVFSSSRIHISDLRNRLGDAVIAALQCVKSCEQAVLSPVDEVREVDDLLKALVKQQVHI